MQVVSRTDNNPTHIAIHYTGGDHCKPSAPFVLTLEIMCGESIFYDAKVDDTDECNPRITFYSKAGCPVASLDALWEWLDNNKIFMCIIFIIFGIAFVFFGRKFVKIILFLTGVLVTVVVSWSIFYSTFLTENTENWVGWVVLIGSALVGVLLGWLLVYLI